ncbi:hypothetical protein AMAG_19572 [Allomyces macrogynus ATCC 38327]|uniref:Uncharacterized protein n=1 Tax=Allomyces macrogynus (strain ATCC 38327) TaxID=578462 RepID=A0A0L0SV34_ALLM3|nr:hypothetical protein AMAG_19572 [Allomyces macrogynus ATCC 38327]|eukprot:KNE66377.1 hypothetical protein AMAG_19572 [Allomyces macrogynus ATCC 38327]
MERAGSRSACRRGVAARRSRRRIEAVCAGAGESVLESSHVSTVVSTSGAALTVGTDRDVVVVAELHLFFALLLYSTSIDAADETYSPRIISCSFSFPFRSLNIRGWPVGPWVGGASCLSSSRCPSAVQEAQVVATLVSVKRAIIVFRPTRRQRE